jgi:hypothetical protein
MGDRWYDAQLGRWISADTIVPDPANPQSFNRYSYVYNNPLKYIDTTGHLPDEELAKLLGFEDKDQMYNSDIWQQLQEDYSDFLAMLRSDDFTYGSVLIAEICTGEFSDPSIVQLMLARTERNEPFMWGLDSHQPMGGITLYDLLESRRWALFKPEDTSDLSAGYNLVSHNGSGAAGLPSPNFSPGYWGEWNEGPYGKLHVQRPNWQVVAWDVGRCGAEAVALVVTAVPAHADPEPLTKVAWWAGAVAAAADWGTTIYDATHGGWTAPETFVYPGEPGSGKLIW